MSSHSKYSASGAHRWVSCAGSLVLSKFAPPRKSGLAANRGTAAHEIAAEYLQGADDIEVDSIGREVEVEGQMLVIDEDMDSQIKEYVAYVRSISGTRLIEVQSNYAAMLGLSSEKAWGTSDAVVISDNVLHIIDLKTGRQWVGATENLQLTLYAAGVVDSLNAVGLLDTIDTFKLTIVQPAVKDAPEVWTVGKSEFFALVEQLKEAAAKTEEAERTFTGIENPVWAYKYLTPSEEACRYCPAAAICPSLRAVTQGADRPLIELSTEELNDAMKRIPLIETWIEAVRAKVHAAATRGQEGLAFKLVLGREGNRKWVDEKAAATVLEQHLQLDQLFTEPSLKTPAKIDKLLPKGSTLLADLVMRAPAKPTLVPSDDPRPQWIEDEDEFEVVK